MKAKLVLAGNDIGNRLDIPARSLDLLRHADLLVFEEDRMARTALKSAGIHRDYLRLSEHQQAETLEAVKQAFLAGQTVAYMTDQGMPNLCDPGSLLLDIAYEWNVAVAVIPGPSSLTAAVAACPLVKPEEGFYFVGLLPRESNLRRAKLNELKKLSTTKFILDTPYRIQALVEDCIAVYGSSAKAYIGLDISGPEEKHCCEDLGFLLSLAGITEAKNRHNFVFALR